MQVDHLLIEFLKNNPQSPLNHFKSDQPLISAATLSLLIQKNNQDYIIFNKRTNFVEHHKGQICFPGGVKDLEDKDLIETAKRETFEEMGIDPKFIKILGKLGQITTPTGYLITPFIGRLTKLVEYNPSPIEIDEVFEIPLHHLLDEKNFRIEPRQIEGISFQTPVFLFKEHKIWGATGRILENFVKIYQKIYFDKTQY